jgi:hypothetical protein
LSVKTPRKIGSRRSRFGQVFRWLLVLEIAWLVLFNGLLWLPPTQQAISAVRPEKLAVRWERAWTLAPFHVEVRGLFANGNARRQMWQVEAVAASGWINPVPLLWKQVSLHAVEGRDVDYRQRPRPRADRDYSASEAWFPEIEGREVAPADLRPYRSKRPWRVVLGEAEVGGRFDYWIYQLRGTARGRLSGNLDYRTRGGPLRLDVNELDLELGRHVVNGEHVVFDEARAQGALGFAPFRPREDRGVALLRALHFDLDLDADLESLAFLNVFLLDFQHFRVDGSGEVVGRLGYDRGVVQPGTDLAVAARNLEVGLMGHRIEGMGTVGLRMEERTAGQMELAFYYGDLRVLHETSGAELLTGQGLMLQVGGDGRVLPDPDEINASRFIGLDIGRLNAPDFATFQRYLPERWPFRLHGGRGTLSGTVSIRPTAYAVDLALESDEADFGIADYRFLGDLDAGLKLGNPSLTTRVAQADGSYLRIGDARLRRDDGVSENSWSADVELLRGRFDLIAKRRVAEHDVIDLFRILADEPVKTLLADANGAFDFRGQVSELAWLGVFFGDRYRTRTAGSAQLEGTARLESGLPAPGTDITLHSDGLLFNFLDYASRGRGKIHMAVEEGGENADWRIALDLEDADLRRRADRATFIEDVEINVEARIEDVDFDAQDPDYELAFRMPAGRVTDMAIFNRYLPPDAPIALIGGGATLASELTLRPDDADGWVRLDARRVDLVIDGQEVQGDLQADIAVSGGQPADMMFDIAGSRLRLDGVSVRGQKADFGDDGWFAELVLTRGDTVFENPLRLDVDAELKASDSRPLVTLFRNQEGWRPEFVARALTVADITGNAQLEMADGRLRIPHAWLNGETIEAGAKAELSGDGNRGVVYLKFRDLDALLRIADGKRKLDILRARRKFDEYRVGTD